MSHKEFPKALYKDGNPILEARIASNAEDAGKLQAAGYKDVEFEPSDELGGLGHIGGGNGLVDVVKTTPAAEKPEDGNIYALTGSAPSPGHFNQDLDGDKVTMPTNPPMSADKTTYQVGYPKGKPRKGP